MSLINNIIDRITEFAKVKGEKIKLDLIAHLSKLMAYLIIFLLILLFGFFFLVFASITAGALINMALDSVYLGYLIVTGFYLVIFILILVLLRTQRMQRIIESFLVKLNNSLNDE